MNEDHIERQAIFKAWQKHKNNEKLNALQKQIVKAIDLHPEFVKVFEDPDEYGDHIFTSGETEPFVHIALHCVIREMISTNSPKGIREIYDITVSESGDKHEVQHMFMWAYLRWIMEREIQDEEGNELEFSQKDFLDFLWNELNPVEDDVN